MSHALFRFEGAFPRDSTWALDRPISFLKLSERAHASLTGLGFKTVRDLLLLTAGELERIPDIGMPTVSQIRDFLLHADLMFGSEAGHVLRPGITVMWNLTKREFSFFLTHPDPSVGLGYGPLILNIQNPIYRLRGLPSFTLGEAIAFLQQTSTQYCDVRHNEKFNRSIFSEYAFDLVYPKVSPACVESQLDSASSDPA